MPSLYIYLNKLCGPKCVIRVSKYVAADYNRILKRGVKRAGRGNRWVNNADCWRGFPQRVGEWDKHFWHTIKVIPLRQQNGPRPLNFTGRHDHFLNSTCDIELTDMRQGFKKI